MKKKNTFIKGQEINLSWPSKDASYIAYNGTALHSLVDTLYSILTKGSNEYNQDLMIRAKNIVDRVAQNYVVYNVNYGTYIVQFIVINYDDLKLLYANPDLI